MTTKIDLSKLPAHIAIIMDGNGRWARNKGRPRIFGHREGTKRVHEIVEECSKLNINVLTLYAFSTENWIRPKSEVYALMSLLKNYLKKELPTILKHNIRLKAIGDISKLPKSVSNELETSISKTENNTGMVLNLALNYGSRQEIVRAVNKLIEEGKKEITEELINMNLDTKNLPDPDLLIRTSGEMRLSNFLLWQIAYTELYVTDVLWPDFKQKNLFDAIINYQSRQRRFGGVQ